MIQMGRSSATAVTTNAVFASALSVICAWDQMPNFGSPANPLPCLSRVTPRSYHRQAYTAGQAEIVFRSQDDLLLNAPTGDFPPTQVFSFTPSAGATPTASTRRQFQGDYSWLATVVPGYRSIEIVTNTTASPTTYTVTPQGDNNAVIVSIVVFWKRIPLDPGPVGNSTSLGADGARIRLRSCPTEAQGPRPPAPGGA